MLRPVLITGVDPGARWTGIVIRSGRELIAHDVATRPKESPISDLGAGLDLWREQVLDAVHGSLVTAREHGDQIALAVEGIVPPSPHVRRRDGNSLTDPTAIMATAVIFGALLQEYNGRVIIVPPGGNGSRVMDSYPVEIRGSGRALKGPPMDKNRHARSAWDVAGAAPFLLGVSRSANRHR